MSRPITEVRHAEFERVDACSLGKLVKKRFDEEAVLRERD
jgi:hypothetical protein